jgi:hypothetical protein
LIYILEVGYFNWEWYTQPEVFFFPPVPSKLASVMAANESTHSTPAKIDAEQHLVEEILVDAQVGKANIDTSRAISSSEGGDSKQVDGPKFLSTTSDTEPIVTRKELWSYYRTSSITYEMTRIDLL